MVKCSNFIGDALDEASALGYEQVLLVGHIGKLVKVAGGIMNTHSRQADCRRELFCAHGAVCGASTALCRALMECATTDACVTLLRENGLLEPVMDSLMAELQRQLERRASDGCQTGALVFSKEQGQLGVTPPAKAILTAWRQMGKEQP